MPIIRGKFRDGRFPLLRVTVSNDLGLPPIDDIGPQTVFTQTETVCALIDTGATSSVLAHSLCDRLRLEQVALKQYLFANADGPAVVTTHAATLLMHAEANEAAERHEWSDILTVGRMDLGSRLYQAVLGMDVLSMGDLSITRGSTITFEF